MNILLIEPDRLLAETYFKALLQAGHQVVACAGAQTAILAADQRTPDLVIMELQLVEHSGIEFLYEFRSYIDWQRVPVIIQTLVPPGEFQASWQLLKNELGVQAYLYKPRTKLADLLAEVNQFQPIKA
ncbi:MAG TPA: response regulator [Candidatus Saccharimonadales bacterium]|jgi:DNA-binding response OmpR family regulator|nr:response regulator [Candidatus Saccharimonadales bacterium]